MEFWAHRKFWAHRIIFGFRKGPEYLYRLFDVLRKQTTCEMKTIEVQVYIQQWFRNEQGTKFM